MRNLLLIFLIAQGAGCGDDGSGRPAAAEAPVLDGGGASVCAVGEESFESMAACVAAGGDQCREQSDGGRACGRRAARCDEASLCANANTYADRESCLEAEPFADCNVFADGCKACGSPLPPFKCQAISSCADATAYADLESCREAEPDSLCEQASGCDLLYCGSRRGAASADDGGTDEDAG